MTRQEALIASRQLAEKLTKSLPLGRRWEGEAWENLGWHFKARSSCGRLEVSPACIGGGFMAFLNEPGRGGGRWTGDGRSPRTAVVRCIVKAQRERDLIQRILFGLEPIARVRSRKKQA